MKRIYLILALAVVAMAMRAQVSFVRTLGKMDGVVTMTVSKAILQMSPETLLGEMASLAPLVDKIDNVQNLRSTTAAGSALLQDRLQQALADNGFELLMDLDKDGRRQTIYHHAYDGDVNQFVLLILRQDRNAVAVVLTGKLTLQDIRDFSKK